MVEMISCLCPTYSRGGTAFQVLVEEAVESFLRQDDLDSELVILNDHPGQHLSLVCSNPRVRIINTPVRHRTLGAKYNALVESAYGELLCPWEDDDISLPHRLSFSRKLLGDLDYFNPGRYWFLDQQGMHHEHSMGVAHNCSIYRRSAWEKVKGYSEVTGRQDLDMDQRLRGLQCRLDPLPVPDWFYIYCWSRQPYHLSGSHDMQGFYDGMANREFPTGRFLLHPRYRINYEGLVQESLKKLLLG